jgi:diguanylate cyclase (GGDEF)-like protein/PAS domain S-box-containing protein
MCAIPSGTGSNGSFQPGRQLRTAQPHYSSMVEYAPHVIAYFDRGGRLTYVNPAAEVILGADRPRWLGLTCGEIAHASGVTLPWDGVVRQVLDSGTDTGGDFEVQTPERTLWLRARIVPELRAAHEVTGVIVFAEDVTEQRARARGQRGDAEFDALSGVHTRTSFLRRLEQACVARRGDSKQPFAVLFLDLDRFKAINDGLGHAVGDALLGTVGRRLVGCVRPTDLVGRLGGDEFAVLLIGAARDAQVVAAVQRIQRRLASPVSVAGVTLTVTASIGLAIGTDGDTADLVLARADRAMYQAKSFGPGHYEVLDAATLVHERATRRLSRDLDRAIAHDELTVWYQPIVSLDDSHVVALEALVRWQHPERGLIGPQAFLPIAEQSRTIIEIDRWVLHAVARQVRTWAQRIGSPPAVPVSVNFSARHIIRPDLPELLARVLRDYHIDARQLMIEVTETSLLKDSEVAAAALARVRDTGIRICLDDFGTGYSSLVYLRQFTFDILKIDRSFVHRLSRDRVDRAIVRGIVRLARTLGLCVTAEGVETRQQHELLRSIGCDRGQGYLFGRPMRMDQAEQLLRRP